MAKFNFKFAVEGEQGKRSSIALLRRSGNQVYVITNGRGGVQKYSFHTPDFCQLAFTKDHAAERKMPKRQIIEWHRTPTTKKGSGQFTRVLRLHYGTNVLSSTYPNAHTPFNAVPAAPPDWSTIVDLSFTFDPLGEVEKSIAALEPKYNHRLLAYDEMPNGEAICLSSHWAEVANDTLDLPAPKVKAGHVFGHLTVTPNDPQKTGRPIRVTVWSHPKFGDMLEACEYGAYPVTD